MTRRRPKPASGRDRDFPPLPLSQEHWQAVVEAMQLSPQEARVVELVLRGACEKQVSAKLGIGVPTIRTYLTRIGAKTETHGRMELALHVLGVSHQVVANVKSHQN